MCLGVGNIPAHWNTGHDSGPLSSNFISKNPLTMECKCSLHFGVTQSSTFTNLQYMMNVKSQSYIGSGTAKERDHQDDFNVTPKRMCDFHVMTWKSKGYHWSCLIALTSGGARNLCWMRLAFFIDWRVVYGIILGASYCKHTTIVGKSMFGILFREGMLVLSRKYCPPETKNCGKRQTLTLWLAFL